MATRTEQPETARAAARAARRRAVEQLRASPGPSLFKVAFYGLCAGAGAAAANGLLYGVIFGVVGNGLNRWMGIPAFTGFSIPLFPLFIGTLFWNSLFGGLLSVPYHYLCWLVPRIAGPAGGIGFVFAVGVLVSGYLRWASAAVFQSGALGVFAIVGSILSSFIIGGVIGVAELFERNPSPSLPTA